MKHKIKKVIEDIIFGSRWLLVAMLIRLGVVLLVIIVRAIINKHLSVDDTVWALEAVDETMVANLIKSVITGSYNSFIDKRHGYDNENASSGVLKVKMGSSLIGISSIYLLKTFLELRDHDIPWGKICKYLSIHGAFLLSSLVLSVIEFLHNKSEYYEKKAEHLENKHPPSVPTNGGIVRMHT